MNAKVILCSLVLVGSLSSGELLAANRYVRSGAAGNATGSDWTNAYTALPATLVRGDTYYIADGTYPPYKFDDPASGSAYIYIKKATVSDHGSATGWADSYGDGEALFTGSGTIWTISTNYLDIDGRVGSGKSPGKYGFRLYSTAARCGSETNLLRYGSPVTHLVVRHTEFDWNNGTSAGNCGVTRAWESGPNMSDYVTIDSNYFHHSSGYAFYLGNYTGRPVQNHYEIRNNYFFSNGGGGGSNYHWELMWLTDLKNSTISNNVLEDTFGSVDAQTGWVMLGGASNIKIYGNLFFCSANCAIGGNGVIATWSADTYRNSSIYMFNNSFINLQGGYGPRIQFTHNSAADTDIQLRNNLYFNPKFSWAGITVQSNEVCGGGQSCSGSNQQSGLQTANFVNYSSRDFRLSGATAPGDSTIGGQYALDMTGTTRGVDGVWDRGAFEFGQNGSTGILSAPTALRFVAQ